MGGLLGSYPVAPLSYLRTARRLVALCALALVLIPPSLAQSPNLIIPTFVPSDGWHGIGIPIGEVSTGSSAQFYAQFSVDSNAWSRVIISAAVVNKRGDAGEAALFEDGQLVLTFGRQPGGVPYDIPEERNHIYNYTIGARPGSPDSLIYVYQIFVTGARSSPTQIGPTTPGATLSGAQTSSIQSSISSTTVVASSASVPSIPLSISLTNIPTTASPTLPTGLLSPPAFTNPPASVSDASLASSGSGASGPNSSAIVGAVFGTLVGITLCIFAALLYRRRRIQNHIAPSTAFMNYRSTTEQPPAYPFNRTSLFRRSRAGLAGFGGLGDRKAASPHSFSPVVTGLGYGATAGAGGRRLTTLGEKSAEGRESQVTASAITPSYEDPHRLAIPDQGQEGMGVGGGGVAGGSLGAAGAGAYRSAASQGLSIDAARTLTPLSSTTSDKFTPIPSFPDQNPYDGLTMPEPAATSHVDPFRTPPADENNTAGRGAWGRA